MPSITVWKCSSGRRYARDDRLQRERDRMLRRAGERRRRSRVRHHASLARASAGIGDLVDDVVDLAAERIERGDRAPPLAAAGTGSCSRSSSRSARSSAGSTRRASCGAFGMRDAMAARREHGVARDAGPVGARELRAPAEDVAAGRVDAVENAVAAGDDAGQLEPEPPRQRARRAGVPIRAARACAPISNAMQRAPRVVAARRRRCAPR